MPGERDDLRTDEMAEAERLDASDIEVQPPRPKTAKEREAEKQLRLQELEEERRREKEEEERQKELERRRIKRKLITPGVVLVVCAITSITMFLMHFETMRWLKVLLGTLLVAWIIGSLIQYMFERFAKQNEEQISDEGEVINKGVVASTDSNGDENG